MCGVDQISKKPTDAIDATSALAVARKAADGALLPPMADWFSDPEVFRRVGQVIAKAKQGASGPKS